MTNRLDTSRDYQQAVAAEFDARPTLRQVAGSEALKILAATHPAVAAANMPNAEPMVLLIPQIQSDASPSYPCWIRRPLVDALLDALLQGSTLRTLGVEGGEFMIASSDEYPFRDAQGPLLDEAISIQKQLDELDALLRRLVQTFCDAQVEYWAQASSLGASRDRWLQLTIKSALLQNLPLQGLDDQQLACVHGLLRGAKARPTVFALEARLECEGASHCLVLPNLLVQGEYDERMVLLWCAPSSVVRAFDSFEAFAAALHDELAEQYRFDLLTWTRYVLQGDPFAQQSALLLEAMLDAIRTVRYWQCSDAGTLQALFAVLSDPARAFIAGYRAVSEPSLPVPPGLRNASGADGFACQAILFELALAQAESAGCSSRDSVMDLHGYAAQRLRSALLEDHPDDANYLPDDLLLTLSIARATPGGASVGPGDGVVETAKVSLVDYAIGKLGRFQDALLTTVEHRHGQLIMHWLSTRYVDELVRRVDIGASYPAYVARSMDASEGKAQRIACFAREWRCALLSAALEAKLAGKLDEAALGCLLDYCRGHLDRDVPGVVLMPLAFRPDADAEQVDTVRGMYLLFSAEPAMVVLYRPLHAQEPIMMFQSLEELMKAIATTGELQDSVLDWLPEQARRVYAHGGLLEPHPLQPILDDSALLPRTGPAVLHASFWMHDVDARLYQANRDLLVELADRQSLSNLERRWALLVQGAWLLFDVASLVLRGPAAVVAWLVQGVAALQSDLPAITQGSTFERSAAIVDLLLGLGMILLHARLPKRSSSSTFLAASTTALGMMPRPRLTVGQSKAMSRQGGLRPAQALAARPGMHLDFSWRGAQGFNALAAAQRERLRGLRSAIDLRGAALEDSGLYKVGEQLYVTMMSDVYAVERSESGVRVIGAQGETGPWLRFAFGAWRVDAALRLRGGMPKSRVQLRREQNQQRLEALKHKEAGLIQQRNALAKTLGAHRNVLMDKAAQILDLEAVANPGDLQVRELALLKDLQKRIRETVVYDLKALIDHGLVHDQTVAEIFTLRHGEQLLDEAVKTHRSELRQELLEYCEVFYNEMVSLINAESLDQLADAIAIHPEDEAEIQQYKRYRDALEKVVKWEADLVEVSGHFDRLLEETLNDHSIVFRHAESGTRVSKQQRLSEIIEKRRLNAVDLEFRLLLDLGELSIDRLAGADERTLRKFEAHLAGDALHSAGVAHGELAGSELGLEERISVLNGVLEAYEEAAVSADYLGSIATQTIRADKLELYCKTLERLKGHAERELEEAVREKELATPRLSRPAIYASRGGRRRVVRTQRGRSVVGTEVVIDGISVVQQRDSRTNRVLKTFHRHGSEWLEDAGSAVETPGTGQEPDALRQRGQALIAEVESVIRLARKYVRTDEPHGLSSVIDLHVEKLLEVQMKLPRGELDAALQRALAEAIERLQAARRDLLIGLYLATSHPTAQSLRFLHEHGQVTITRAGARRTLGPNDYLDVYQIRRKPAPGQSRGEGLWEAHFHYLEASAPARAFRKGHLKLWSQRNLGREAQLRAASTGRDLLAIYRGDLRPEQVEGLIPFE